MFEIKERDSLTYDVLSTHVDESFKLGVIDLWAGEWMFTPSQALLFSLSVNEVAKILAKLRSLNKKAGR